MTLSVSKKRRGRPPTGSHQPAKTRQAIIQSGLEILTEQGVTATGVDQVLRKVGVPKGSFYHYFSSKDIFLQAVVGEYGEYFGRKLDKHFAQEEKKPLDRLEGFLEDSCKGMERYDYRRGCLIGNLGQEVTALSPPLREGVEAVLLEWEAKLEVLLEQSVQQGELSPAVDCQSESRFFWIGWEGAVMRAKLSRSCQPMTLFLQMFLDRLRSIPLNAK
ncbi:MAG: TetR/AcrR family transcriptional regulator [Cellvibrionaceae bacterium]